jgi:hypothetical protein|tara:strand:+ start:935 stop:1861 length:927 start_codon:yes stop_codon:yes gene_type:complete
MSKITNESINDIFSIPSDMSHLNTEDSHDPSYADVSKDVGSNSFLEEVNKVRSTIKSSTDKEEQEEEQEMSEEKKSNNTGWTFNPPKGEDEFFSFYEEKESAIRGWLLPFGEINFQKITSELKKARVDMSSLNYGDLKVVFSLMKEIQQWRDRVAQMAIQVNSQYYSWKRAVDLFTGLLAQYKYEKPAVKQDGVVYAHMGDMIKYYSQLESTHRSIEMILKNLDNAFECLSRQVTISMPGKDHEDLEKKASKKTANTNVNKNNYDSSTDLSDSDKKILSDLDTVSTIKSGQKNKTGIKTGKVEWNANF